MSDHTPGPWELEDYLWVRMSDDEPPIEVTGSLSTPWKTKEANARLIAAAPELLEALEEIVRWWDDKDEETTYAAAQMASVARAAIAKARGTDE